MPDEGEALRVHTGLLGQPSEDDLHIRLQFITSRVIADESRGVGTMTGEVGKGNDVPRACHHAPQGLHDHARGSETVDEHDRGGIREPLLRRDHCDRNALDLHALLGQPLPRAHQADGCGDEECDRHDHEDRREEVTTTHLRTVSPTTPGH